MLKRYWLYKFLVITNEFSTISSYYYSEKFKEWKYLKPEEWVSGEMSAGYVRNSTLVDLTKTPEDIKESIINNYKSQQGQDRSLLLDYFMKNKMKQMIDVIDDF